MGFPDLESALKILRHHRIHKMFDGVFFADEAQEKEPNAEGNQNGQGYAAYRVAESFRVRFFASRIKEGQIYPRLCCVPPLRVGTKLLREQRKLAESPSRSKPQPLSGSVSEQPTTRPQPRCCFPQHRFSINSSLPTTRPHPHLSTAP